MGGEEGVGMEAGEVEGVGREVKGGQLAGKGVPLMVDQCVFGFCPHACDACGYNHPCCCFCFRVTSCYCWGSVVGVVRHLQTFWEFNNCELGVFRF